MERNAAVGEYSESELWGGMVSCAAVGNSRGAHPSTRHYTCSCRACCTGPWIAGCQVAPCHLVPVSSSVARHEIQISGAKHLRVERLELPIREFLKVIPSGLFLLLVEHLPVQNARGVGISCRWVILILTLVLPHRA